jgi:HEAT repeat protein
MKNPVRLALSVTLSALMAGAFGACSKDETGASKVDVTANTAALKSADKDARINACIELAKAGEKAAPAVPALIPLLKDQDALVRRLAAYAIGQVGPKASQAVPALKELLQDPDRQVVSDSINALKAIDPKGYADVKVVNVSGAYEPPPAPRK